jgi:MacB-like periplasmic core domain
VLTLACRWVMSLAERLVPETLRDTWREDWRSGFWDWTLKAAHENTPDAKQALMEHMRRALAEAWKLQFQSEVGRADWASRVGKPRFALLLGAIPLLLVTLWSGAFSASRRLIHGLPYPEANRVFSMTQGAPFLGARLGFAESEADVFRGEARSIESIATYQWYRASYGKGQVPAAAVSPGFFTVFQVRPMLGQDFSKADAAKSPFVASFDFWKHELGGRPDQIGKTFWVSGRQRQLVGVMPQGFWFLIGDTGLWTLRDDSVVVVSSKWWTRLRNTVVRLKPGVTETSLAKDIREVQTRKHMGRGNWGIFAVPLSSMMYQTISLYGEALASGVGVIALWAALQVFLEYRRGKALRGSIHYWGFLVLKVLAPFAAVFFMVCEFTGSNTMTMAARSWWERMFVNDWFFFCSVVLFAFWAFRDQRARCRVCLQRMREPVRIGIPGQILLETAGVEVMCPLGHGAVYTSESVLGSEMSNQWMGFEDVLR